MYKIKQIPEDFIVKELIKPEFGKAGEYSYFWMKKKEETTIGAAEKISNALGIPLKNIGFAGTKDRKAVTEQMISIKGARSDPEKLKITNISLKFMGKGSEPLSLGDNEGNEFIITIRNLDSFAINKVKFFPNLFGEQRFSTNNAEIGKAMIRKDFKKAVSLILEVEKDHKRQIEELLQENPNNFVNALKVFPKKILMLYLHSYQSRLWNEIAEGLRGEFGEKTNPKISIPGFGTDVLDIENEKVRNAVEKIMRKERISPRDFIVKELQGLSPEGGERELFAEITDLKVVERGEDELNEGKKKIKLSFRLKKGCYATEAIKALMPSQHP